MTQLLPMTPDDCCEAARLHARAFFKGWDAHAFQAFLADPLVHGLKVVQNDHLCGYILWRAIDAEAEILTLVVDPSSQRSGLGGRLLSALFTHLREKKIAELFLEVAEDNAPARFFYTKHGFIFLSKRPKYYPRENQPHAAALNFAKKLRS